MRSDRAGEGKSDQCHLEPSSLTPSWHMQSQHCVHKGENAAKKCFYLRCLFCRYLGGKCAAAQMVQSNAFHQICGLGLGAVPVPHKPCCHLIPPVPACGNQSWAGQGQTPSSWLADVSEAAVTPTLPHLDHEELPPSGITAHKCQSSGHSTDLSDV